MRLGPFEAAQAAEHLNVDIFDLAWALQDKALALFDAERSKITDGEQPNLGRARAFIRASEACFQAHEQETAVRAEVA